MRPSKEKAKQSDRIADLKGLWSKLGEEPPGPIVEIRPALPPGKDRKRGWRRSQASAR
jgi:hypothetical protein